MVYIPWAEKGICKFWMLQRCYSGDECKWRHPEPTERSLLWDYYSEQQRLDEENGIPPPKNPLKQSPATDTGKEASRSGPDRPTPSPPVSPPPPPNTPKRSCLPNRDIDKSRDPRLFRRLPAQLDGESGELPSQDLEPHKSTGPAKSDRGAIPPARNPIEHQVSINRKGASDVSILDAPPSPKKDRREGSLAGVNTEPLGRPNRLRQAKNDDGQAQGWTTGSTARRTRFDCKTTKYRYVEVPASLLSQDVPSRGAITLWKRGEGEATDDDTHMTKSKASLPRQGLYWEKLRERKATVTEVKKEDSAAADAAPHVKPPKSRDSRSHLTLIPRQISRIKASEITSSSPLTQSPLLEMGATKRLANGETKHVGPHPSTIRVSTQYMSQAAISKKLQQSTAQGQLDIQERSIAEAREDTIRLQGVGWIDSVRRSLQLPIRTYTTACVYFHKFRLAHAGNLNDLNLGNAWPDACAASLLTSCKVEDTLKKSRDILAAAYNLKATTHEQLGSDDPVFEGPSRVVIGLERLVLEAGGFDFRSKYPHRLMVKLAKSMPEGEDGEREKVAKASWSVLTDLYRTFAPLKQTSVTMALASLELAAHLVASSAPNNMSAVRDALQQVDLKAWSTSREEIMETVLDLLDLYTQHTSQTILGPKYSLDDFLRIRLAFNKECNESNIPRYTTAPPSDRAANGSTLRVANGHPTPVSPMEPGPQAQPQTQSADMTQTVPEGGGTLRFMLNPHLAADEKAQVQKYFVEEWEEYEEEVEIPQPRQPSGEREREPAPIRDRERASSDRPRDAPPPRAERTERSVGRGREDRERPRERDRAIERDREAERERVRPRDADRDGRYAGRRYDDRDRRYDDGRDRRFEGRRYEDDRRRDRR